MTVGYARVHNEDDSHTQRTRLDAAGIDVGFIDLGIGNPQSARRGLDDALAHSRGGTLIVPTISRLARTASDLGQILMELQQQATTLQVLDPPRTIPPVPPLDGASIVALLARFDQELESARETPTARRRGRKPSLTPAQERTLIASSRAGQHPDQIAEMFGISRATVYRILERAQPADDTTSWTPTTAAKNGARS